MTDPRAQALSALTRFQVTDLTVGQTLDKIAQITMDAVPGATMAAMTVLSDDARPTTAIYTHEEVLDIDAGQYADGAGPCLDAWRLKRVLRVDDVAIGRAQWPTFVERCHHHGVLSTLSLPLVSGDVALGAMNLYGRRIQAFTEDDEALGLELAAAAGTVVANVAAYWTAFDLSQQLSQAIQTRGVIEQAKGMLMGRSPELDADGAFELLRKASQRENVKLRDIAQRIVDRRGPSES